MRYFPIAVVILVLAMPQTVRATVLAKDDSAGLEIPFIVVQGLVAGINVYELTDARGSYVTGAFGLALGSVSIVLANRDHSIHPEALRIAALTSIVLGLTNILFSGRDSAHEDSSTSKVQLLPLVAGSFQRQRTVGLQCRILF